MPETLQMILIVLILILMALIAMLALQVSKRERIPLPERMEDRKLMKEHRAEQRAQKKETIQKEKLMREVEQYDGTKQ